MKSHKVRNRWWDILALALLVCIVCLPSYSADLVVIRGDGEPILQERQLEIAAAFYGLDVRVISIQDGNPRLAFESVRQAGTVAVAVQANTLGNLNCAILLDALSRKPDPGVPLLIFGVTQDTRRQLLSTWSDGALAGVERLRSQGDLHYDIGRVKGVTQELSGLSGRFPQESLFSFVVTRDKHTESIMTMEDDHDRAAIFVSLVVHQQRMFFLCNIPLDPVAGTEWSEEFATIAPVIMFVKYSAGDRGWHTPYHYANLTVDDPWLRESYGHLSYKNLLHEMEVHNFHTTIAFIPWNYDRSNANVVSLIRSHPDRFSVCIHGNNHDHKEFTDYRAKSLSAQIYAIKQSLARMEAFRRLTGIRYDKVMIFPHSIAPTETLEALKTYNFIATINSTNVPMDRPDVPPLAFTLRPVTIQYGDFASVVRYPAWIPRATIMINEFLGNPVLFYCHQDFFTAGADAFSRVADEVNRGEPGTRWRSLGEIARHLYLQRTTGDSEYDVLTFSADISLENVSAQDAIFHVTKPETGQPPIRSLTVDGTGHPYTVQDGELTLSLRIRAKSTRRIIIEYANDLNLSEISLKSSGRTYLLRTASDIRDIALSRYAIGRAFIDLYYWGDLTRAAMWVCGTILMVGLGWSALCLGRVIRPAWPRR